MSTNPHPIRVLHKFPDGSERLVDFHPGDYSDNAGNAEVAKIHDGSLLALEDLWRSEAREAVNGLRKEEAGALADQFAAARAATAKFYRRWQIAE
jgi:hypothetical protein